MCVEGGGARARACVRAVRARVLPAHPPPPPLTHTQPHTDAHHLRDPAFLTRALRYRTARLLHTLAARLRKHSRRLGEFHAWNKCLLHVLVRGVEGGGGGCGCVWGGGDCLVRACLLWARSRTPPLAPCAPLRALHAQLTHTLDPTPPTPGPVARPHRECVHFTPPTPNPLHPARPCRAPTSRVCPWTACSLA